jgi:hypothetical protein
VDNSIYSERFLPVPGESAARAEHFEFPKVLVHPDHQPRQLITAGIPGNFGSNPIEPVWSPEKFAPVTARSADEEAKYLAMGYRPAGKSDPAAFATVNASPTPPDYEFRDFPKWVRPPSGDPVLVKSAQEEAALLARWSEGTKKRAGVERKDAAA